MVEVSIIIAAFNAEKYIDHCLWSARNQTHDNIEVIIVDDGSTDQTWEKIQPHLSDPRVRALQQPNRGAAVARNAAVAVAQGRWLAILDADDFVARTRVAEQLAAARADSRLGVVGSWALLVDGAGRPFGAVTPLRQDVQIRKMMCERMALVHASCMIDRALFLRAGQYDERLSIAHDYEMLARVIQLTRVETIPSYLYAYRIHGSQLSGVSDLGRATRRLAGQRVAGARARGEAAPAWLATGTRETLGVDAGFSEQELAQTSKDQAHYWAGLAAGRGAHAEAVTSLRGALLQSWHAGLPRADVDRLGAQLGIEELASGSAAGLVTLASVPPRATVKALMSAAWGALHAVRARRIRFT